MKKIALLKNLLIVVVAIVSLNSCKKGHNDKIIEDLQKENNELKLELNSSKQRSAQLELNKSIVTNFFKEVFIEMKLDSIHKYIGDTYIQHDPEIADGKQALIDEMKKRFKHMSPNQVEIIRVIAENNLVFIHTKFNASEAVLSLMHVFRIESDEIVEHWISVQAVPEKSKNDNTLF